MDSILMSRVMTIFVLLFLRLSLRYAMETMASQPDFVACVMAYARMQRPVDGSFSLTCRGTFLTDLSRKKFYLLSFLSFLYKIVKVLQIGLVIIASYAILCGIFQQSQPLSS